MTLGLGDLSDREDRRSDSEGHEHLPSQPRKRHEDVAQERQ